MHKDDKQTNKLSGIAILTQQYVTVGCAVFVCYIQNLNRERMG